MLWARLLAYVTGTVNQELLLRNEYLAAENRILRGQIKGRLLLSEGEKGCRSPKLRKALNLGRVTMLQSTLHAIHFKRVFNFGEGHG